MAHGNTTDTDNAAQRLHQLHTYFREHPVTGPTEGRAGHVTAPAPMNLGVLDHMTASVREVVDHTRSVNPAAGPLPQRVRDVYAWCHENLEHADEDDRQRLQVIEYRQYLEHAIRAGDTDVIPPHRCPECRTWGLMWLAPRQRALCTNRECVDQDGLTHTFDLARLAYEHVAAQQSKKISAG
jgi:hypothetical protein